MGKEDLGNHVIQYPKEYSLCEGCGTCKLVCALSHDGITGPYHGAIELSLDSFDRLYHTIYACQHCADHPCYNACPKKDKAMCIDESSGIVYINEEACIGCGLCAKKCRFTPSRITMDRKNRKAKKCDLCRTREDGPQCIKYCPVQCLGLSENPLPYEAKEGEQ